MGESSPAIPREKSSPASRSAPQPYFAHSPNAAGHWHDLAEHLRGVAKLAGEFASKFGASDYGHLSGLWHDLGKYSASFQSYLRRSGNGDSEAHVETAPGRVNHSSAGALHAVKRLGDQKGKLLAYLIAGHHAGLPDWHGDEHAAASLSNRLRESHHLDEIPLDAIPEGIFGRATNPISKPQGGRDGLALWLRMLFSCLVDADSIDTESFSEPEKNAARGRFADMLALLSMFDAHMAGFDSVEKTPVNRIRAEILSICRNRAGDPPGLFSLTVPTGGGKTLSSMAFALRHAVRHRKPRVIYAIPYTSIIEQTAAIFRGIFGDEVIEHHSNLDPEKESAKSLLASENWDAPIIVTTNVQFFESLFESRRSRCRKLHNVVNSVVVLDEAQLLPPDFLQPILDVMNLLTKHYGVTILLSTATQPALGSLRSFDRGLRGLENVREIVPEPNLLHEKLKRVEVNMPRDLQARLSWDDLAAELSEHDCVLTVVNTRSDCRELHRRLSDGAIHLSAAMCGEHRASVITGIKKKLAGEVPVRVVSTQLVEAGVDLDFPVVYRALSGLDSIAQAAGRCNREGKLEKGRVVVFIPPRASPPGTLRRAEDTTVSLLNGTPGDPLAPELFRTYFEHFYLRADSLDRADIKGLLTADAGDFKIQFRTAAEKFRLIDDRDSRPVIVWHGEGRKLAGLFEEKGPERWLLRKLQRYSVNVPTHSLDRLLTTGEIREVHGYYVQSADTLYDEKVGLVLDGALSSEQLVI